MARPESTEGAALDPALAQKKRARRRLVGALVLGLAAAIVLPLVLDSEPRQTITDVQIEIPPRDAPLPRAADEAAPAVPITPSEDVAAASPGSRERAGAAGGAAGSANGSTSPSQAADAANAAEAKSAQDRPDAQAPEGRSKDAAPAQRESDAETRSAAKAPSGSEREADAPATERKLADAKPHASSKTPASTSAPKATSGDAARARNGAGASHEAAAGGKFALQIGAYASAASVRAQSERVRKAGMRPYTEVVKTSSGSRTRVRVGPFATREAAERARASLKLAGVDSAVVAQ